MLEILIPGAPPLRLEHLVADFNGTLACDGMLLPGVEEALTRLAQQLTVHVITADTFGSVRAAVAGIPCRLALLPESEQDGAKLRYVEALGAARCVCIGNGRNDRRMLAAAGLGIAVVQREGAAVETLLAARVAVPDIDAALGLLLEPRRLTATLRL
jgi:soluble P-type ATPase